jgi:hypothetical protein
VYIPGKKTAVLGRGGRTAAEEAWRRGVRHGGEGREARDILQDVGGRRHAHAQSVSRREGQEGAEGAEGARRNRGNILSCVLWWWDGQRPSQCEARPVQGGHLMDLRAWVVGSWLRERGKSWLVFRSREYFVCTEYGATGGKRRLNPEAREVGAFRNGEMVRYI